MTSRYQFLCGGAAATVALPALLQPIAAQAASNTTLVAILLAGGCDGLNTVVPLGQFGNYNGLRQPAGLNYTQAALAATAFDANTATPAASATQFAFNPTMTSLRQVYAGGHLAVLCGVGIMPDEPNRLSHEVGQFDWASGTIKMLGQTTLGWLGQALDASPAGALPPLISLTGQAPTLLTGRVQSPLVLGVPLESFQLNYGNFADVPTRQAQYAAIQGQPLTGKQEQLRALSVAAQGFTGKVQAVATSTPAADYPVQTSFIGLQLQQIARLIVSGATGARAYYAVHGGFDTHANQMQVHPTLLGQLSDAVATFYAYLRQKNASSNVVIMTFSDFGRRAAGNSTSGTDHGTASVSFVLGDPVRGGIYGQYPSLTALDSAGNLQVQVDFRNELSDVISYLGGDPNPIVGQTYPKLGFI